MDGCNGGQCLQAQLQVKVPPAQVVHNADVVAASREVQRSGPAAVPVTPYAGMNAQSARLEAEQGETSWQLDR
jgi:hypothetical protein